MIIPQNNDSAIKLKCNRHIFSFILRIRTSGALPVLLRNVGLATCQHSGGFPDSDSVGGWASKPQSHMDGTKKAAKRYGTNLGAIVRRGGRPDRLMDFLPNIAIIQLCKFQVVGVITLRIFFFEVLSKFWFVPHRYQVFCRNGLRPIALDGVPVF